jgi:hypothetical protein
MQANSDGWRRRQAIHLVSQLPESHEDALAVLAYAHELLTGFLAPVVVIDAGDHAVLAFSSASERHLTNSKCKPA